MPRRVVATAAAILAGGTLTAKAVPADCSFRSRPEVMFTEHLIDGSFGAPSGFDLGDVDLDGRMDVVGADYGGDQIAWWRNEGGDLPQWTRHVVATQFDGAIDVVLGDIDGDGDPDIAGASWDGHEVAWWENAGGEPVGWTKHALSSAQTNAHEVWIQDMNGDGSNDIIAAIAGTNSIMLWLNEGGEMTAHTLASGFGGARSVFVADLDDDGDPDVVGAALAANRVAWWRNDGGSPPSWTEFDISTSYAGAHHVCAHDMDGDGDLDVVASGYFSPTLCWWGNDGGYPITWSQHTVDAFPGATMAYAADLDDDGRPDLVATAQDYSHVAWWHNDGNDPLAWTRHTIDEDFGGVWPLSLGDLDANGTIDIVAGGNSVGEVRWWKNHPVWLMPSFTADPSTGHAPFLVQFTDETLAWPPPLSWAWDLDGDGTIDSNEQNPSWQYDGPGSYTVTLTVASDSLAESCTKSDYILVFDGESALHFDGSSSLITCGASSSLSLTDALTVEAWIRPEGWGEVQGSGYGRIVDKNRLALYLSGHSTYGDSCLVFMLFTASGGMSVTMSPAGSIALGQWQHVAATYDAASSVAAIYIDGIAQPLTQTRPPSGAIAGNAAHDLLIGNSSNLAATFDGAIDEVRVWSIARSEGEIRASLGGPLPGPTDGMVGYWLMNEGSGAQALDSSGEANHGAVVGCQWVQGTPFPLPSEVAADSNLPARIRILGTRPNPFAASTAITLEMPRGTSARLTVLDLAGRCVRSMRPIDAHEGRCTVMWNGLDDRGAPVPTGVYVIRADAGAISATGRCVLVR